MKPTETLSRPRTRTILGLLCIVPLCGVPAHAGVVLDVYQSGANVVASYSGTIDLSGLTYNGVDGVTPAYVWGAEAVLLFGPTVSGQPVYLGISGPASFGTGAVIAASSSTGDTFGIGGLAGDMLLPLGYVSGTSISGTDTWDSTTLAALGLTVGDYSYTWGDPDTVNVVVSNTAPVPEPASLGLVLLSLIVLARLAPMRRSRV